ncbi:MAG: phosphatidate cytidylyltransferase [Flavobacteriaceae bacterium]|jgi:phosphatidate cytidylyltransferase|nr:phosphatidate cytidylyltransferase [Flavobacteriaceae bacterium]
MSETVKRTLSGIVYIVLLISATLYGAISFEILFGLFTLIAAYEFAKLIKFPISLSIIIALMANLSLFFARDILPIQIIVALACIMLLILLAELFSTKKRERTFANKVILVLGYIIFPFLALQYLPYQNGEYTSSIFICTLVMIWTNDTFAYIVGKKFGKNKLFERISPKKTIEGFVGGIVFAIIAAIILGQFFNDLNIVSLISSAIFVGVFGTIGDLVESRFKREANVKDSGNIMPGHGGILDRLDSLIFIAPFLYFIFQIL